jgi:hypothetical protein
MLLSTGFEKLSKGKKFSVQQKLTGIHFTSSDNGVHSLAESIKPW